MARFTLSSHRIGRLVVAAMAFLLTSFWLLLTSLAPNALPLVMRSKGIAFIPLLLAGFLLLTDLLVWDRTASPISVQRFLGNLVIVCGVATVVLGTIGMVLIATVPDASKVVAVVFIGGCGLGLAILNCLFWYVVDTASQTQTITATSGSRTSQASDARRVTAFRTARTALTAPSQLPAWRRQLWLMACLVAVAVPLSAFSVLLAQPPGSDWRDAGLLLGLLSGIWSLLLMFLRSAIIGTYR